ncbi:alkaline phosphatase family protein [Candidatus Poribacteria bacterium]|nr:alkaline phosphatase family protein [Candidatus Poribacteria bacterium]
MIFIDGIGVGKKDPAINPFAALPSQTFTDFLDDRHLTGVHDGLALRADASLGVEGIPQSATGQTALLTGVNAAAAIGRHLNGFPSRKLRDILHERSIFKKLTEGGVKACFINVFNPLFFEALEKNLPIRNSVTTVANMAASLRFFGIEDLVKRRAVYQEFTNQMLIEKGFHVPAFTPREAGEILARSAAGYDFCLYEYFQTDAAGHAQGQLRAIEEVSKLDEFLLAVLDKTDLKETSIILSSDHGNLEDLSTSQHTSNPVPVLLWGELARNHPEIKSILDVTPLIMKSFRLV